MAASVMIMLTKVTDNDTAAPDRKKPREEKAKIISRARRRISSLRVIVGLNSTPLKMARLF